MESFGNNVMKEIEIIDNKDIKIQDSIIGDDVARVRQSEPENSERNIDSIGFHEVFLVNYAKDVLPGEIIPDADSDKLHKIKEEFFSKCTNNYCQKNI
jgi:hypothetical protein